MGNLLSNPEWLALTLKDIDHPDEDLLTIRYDEDFLVPICRVNVMREFAAPWLTGMLSMTSKELQDSMAKVQKRITHGVVRDDNYEWFRRKWRFNDDQLKYLQVDVSFSQIDLSWARKLKTLVVFPGQYGLQVKFDKHAQLDTMAFLAHQNRTNENALASLARRFPKAAVVTDMILPPKAQRGVWVYIEASSHERPVWFANPVTRERVNAAVEWIDKESDEERGMRVNAWIVRALEQMSRAFCAVALGRDPVTVYLVVREAKAVLDSAVGELWELNYKRPRLSAVDFEPITVLLGDYPRFESFGVGLKELAQPGVASRIRELGRAFGIPENLPRELLQDFFALQTTWGTRDIFMEMSAFLGALISGDNRSLEQSVLECDRLLHGAIHLGYIGTLHRRYLYSFALPEYIANWQELLEAQLQPVDVNWQSVFNVRPGWVEVADFLTAVDAIAYRMRRYDLAQMALDTDQFQAHCSQRSLEWLNEFCALIDGKCADPETGVQFRSRVHMVTFNLQRMTDAEIEIACTKVEARAAGRDNARLSEAFKVLQGMLLIARDQSLQEERDAAKARSTGMYGDVGGWSSVFGPLESQLFLLTQTLRDRMFGRVFFDNR